MANVNHVEHKGHEQGEAVSAHVKLRRFVGRGHHLPFLGKLMSIDIGQLADLPHLDGQLRPRNSNTRSCSSSVAITAVVM